MYKIQNTYFTSNNFLEIIQKRHFNDCKNNIIQTDINKIIMKNEALKILNNIYEIEYEDDYIKASYYKNGLEIYKNIENYNLKNYNFGKKIKNYSKDLGYNNKIPVYILVDGTSLFCRMFYGNKKHCVSNFNLNINKIRTKYKFKDIIIVMDSHKNCFRHQIYHEYKKNRKEHPKDFFFS